MAKGLARGEEFSWLGYLLTHLPEEVGPSSVFPLQAMDANILRWYPGPPDETVCGPYQSDGNPTLDIPEHPKVGLPPLCCKATGYPFQVSRCLHIQ